MQIQPDLLRNISLVAVGGAAGAVARYVTSLAAAAIDPHFPYGTMGVNLLGAFAMGCLLPLLPAISAPVQALIVVGFLGGFTTMSSFSGEIVRLFAEARWGAAALHWAGGAIACVGLAALGALTTSYFRS